MRYLKHSVQTIVFLILTCTQIIFCLAKSDAPQQAALSLAVEGKALNIEAYIPKKYTEFELRIQSSRNDNITRISTVSPHDPMKERRKRKYHQTPKDTWYPVVDIRIENGMEGICILNKDARGEYAFGGPFFRAWSPIFEKCGQLILPSHKMEHWENSLCVSNKEIEVEKFYIRKTYPVLLREFRHTIQLLSEDWQGEVAIYGKDDDGLKELVRTAVAAPKTEWHHTTLQEMKGRGMSRERLVESLKALIDDGLRRQNNNPDSPAYGSFHTFYDLEARLHRTSYWLWGGSPIVKMVLDALQYKEITEAYDQEDLVDAMRRVGDLYIKHQVREEGHPSRGSYLVIWNRDPGSYKMWVGTSDSGVMHKWVMIPLFLATGDSSYLESSSFWCIEKGKLLPHHKILPHNYLYQEDQFSNRILDETGWDPEGHQALYEATGKDIYRNIAKEFMRKHMAKFQNENGLWNRSYSITQGSASPPSRMTRGTGWSMEGLLAMNAMFPDTIYLEYARRMAAQLAERQKPEGHWNFVFKDAEHEGYEVPTDKGTPLWSLLFYRLYNATGDKQYLTTARNALNWCLENQYTGPDPEAIGALVGRTNASMVGYRYFYDSTCAYATGFFGLAILEELKLQEQGL